MSTYIQNFKIKEPWKVSAERTLYSYQLYAVTDVVISSLESTDEMEITTYCTVPSSL
jgi:hypothetical protein